MAGIYARQAKRIGNGTSKFRPLVRGDVMPKYILPGNVYDAALNRIRWLIDEFDGRISVSNSGGKDSTVCVELALIAAREKGALPLKVVWLDQECEYESTVVYQRWMDSRPEVDFQWYQIPFKLFNATNHDDPWLNVWGEGEEWVRPKEPDSIHQNTFFNRRGQQIDRFKDVLSEINKRTGGAVITGMRCEESPNRRAFMTSAPMYKWVTWCSEGWHGPLADGTGPKSWLDPETPGPLYWMFHPIYDWNYRDVWKAIHDNGWRYNSMYDVQFQYGIPVRAMRVSNYHHETALKSLTYLQEAEPETWEAATRRLSGINAVGHWSMNKAEARVLPYMFTDWEEYLFHLIDKLCADPKHRDTYRRRYDSIRRYYPDIPRDDGARAVARSVINGDLYGTTVSNWLSTARFAHRVRAVDLDMKDKLA